ncbi:MAG: hypothetical protein LBP22_10825 [Deltaproteobacteria bacterium]|jgi:hypothetical protein|nr:hypothetical protein [Deltaproteobacteria bacterium]
MILIFTQYVLPFLAFVSVWGYIALRIHCLGGPAMPVITFADILFGPSLLYALIADDSNTILVIRSLITALVVVFIV